MELSQAQAIVRRVQEVWDIDRAWLSGMTPSVLRAELEDAPVDGVTAEMLIDAVYKMWPFPAASE